MFTGFDIVGSYDTNFCSKQILYLDKDNPTYM